MRTVHELNQEELEELRSRFYHQHLDEGSLEQIVGSELCEEEDFWCNL
jgi:hypothetical protein